MVVDPIRLNWHYVIWYRNFAGMLVSLVLPFTLLAYWNFNTLSVLLRRRRLRNRPRQVLANGSQINHAIHQPNPTGMPPELAVEMLNNGMALPHGRTKSSFEQGVSIHSYYLFLIIAIIKISFTNFFET